MSAGMMHAGRRSPRRGTSRADQTFGAATVAIIGGLLVLLTWTLWLAGQVSGLVIAWAWPASGPSDAPGIVLRLLAHPGHPAAAWPAEARSAVAGPIVVYGLWVVLLTVHGTVLLAAGVRVWRLVRGRSGFATRRDLNQALTASAIKRDIERFRPSLQITEIDDELTRSAKRRRAADPLEGSRPLGVDVQSGQQLYVPIELSEAAVSGPRAGKTGRAIIPRIIDARGPVIATSTRLDVVEPTFDLRAERGPTWVFEPQGIVPGVPRLRWSPIAGCEDRLVAILRARGFAAGAGVGANMENGEYFQGEASAILRALLHAAALDETVTMRDVVTWGRNLRQERPEKILRAHDAGDWAETLTDYRESRARSADVVKSVVSRALDCFADPRVLAACSPPREHMFNAAEWLADNGTLYLVGTRDAQASVAPLMAAMVEDLGWVAKQRAMRSPGGRCDPHLTVAGDEMAHIAPIPSLGSFMAEGGGSGIATTISAQSLHQLKDRFGDHGGAAIAAAANVRILFGGTNDVGALKDVQELAGPVDEVTGGISYGGGRTSVNEQVRREHLVSLSQLRTLPAGHAFVLAANLPPLEVRMPAWWEREDADALHAAQASFRTRLAKAER